MQNYIHYLNEKGQRLSEINPGSNEYALSVPDALQFIELLDDTKTIILGGDILTEKNNRLIYVYQLWGEKYQYLNWHCDKKKNEINEIYIERSREYAKNCVNNANAIATKLQCKCYIVLVLKQV